jgi:hypothetical protein
MRTGCEHCWFALLERRTQKAPAAAATSKTTAPAPMPASMATPSPPELASTIGAAVDVPVSGAASGPVGDETAPTEMPEDARTRLRFSGVAAVETDATSSCGTW